MRWFSTSPCELVPATLPVHFPVTSAAHAPAATASRQIKVRIRGDTQVNYFRFHVGRPFQAATGLLPGYSYDRATPVSDAPETWRLISAVLRRALAYRSIPVVRCRLRNS